MTQSPLKSLGSKQISLNVNPETFRRYAQSLAPLITKPKNRAYTTTILSFLVVSLFLWYAIRPTVQTILSLRREIQDSEGVNKQMEDKISALVEAQALYQQVGDRLHLIDEAMPKGPEEIPFLLQLQRIASNSGAIISGIQASQTSIENTDATVPGALRNNNPEIQPSKITISVDGRYASLQSFLESLLNMRRLVSITSFSLVPNGLDSRAATQSSDPQIRLLMKLDALSYPGGRHEQR